jgi:hypothetical protein
MTRLRTLLASLLLIVAAPLVTLGGTATVQASSTRSAGSARTAHAVIQESPDFTCKSGELCVYQNTGYTGTPCTFDKDTSYSLRACGLSIPWGSFNNEWPNSVTFTDLSTNKTYCFLSGTKETPGSDVRGSGHVQLSTVNSCP